MKNNLPKYWVVKNPNQIVKDYLAKTYNVPDVLSWNHDFIGFDDAKCYNGVHGTNYLKFLYNNPVVLTIDEFIELSKEVDDFVLPEKWYVEVTNEQDTKEIQDYFDASTQSSITGKWFYSIDKRARSKEEDFLKEYDKITFEQFLKYVLKKETMEKEIIGYKCPIDLFNGNVKKDWILFKDSDGNTYRPKGHGPLNALPKEIVEQWEPVYKESIPDITINGYKGEFFDTYVKFGCAEISKEVFIDLFTCKEYKNTNRDVESVTIGKGIFTKEQIKEIAEYYLNK